MSQRTGQPPDSEGVDRVLPWLVVLFIVSLIVPVTASVGPLRLSPYRLVLIAAAVPCLFGWLAGRAGGIKLPDILLACFCLWCTLSAGVHEGVTRSIEIGGVLWIETMISYLLARCYIRNSTDFLHVVRLLFYVVLILAPFAIIEAVSGQNLWRSIFEYILPIYHDVYMTPRWGLRRVQGPFEHPILFGVFCGSILAMTFVVLGYQRGLLMKFTQTGVVAGVAALSLSSGPLSALVAQFMLLVWNYTLRFVASRWLILSAGLVAIWMFFEIFATRSPAQIFIANFSFNQYSAYLRIHQWNFGTLSIMAHPMFGIGFAAIERPWWMGPSIDMFWIVAGIRHGLPASLLFSAAFVTIYLKVAFHKGLNDTERSYRMAYLICLTGFFIVGWTVHFWNATYVLFMFLLGSGVWLLDASSRASRALDPGADVSAWSAPTPAAATGGWAAMQSDPRSGGTGAQKGSWFRQDSKAVRERAPSTQHWFKRLIH